MPPHRPTPAAARGVRYLRRPARREVAVLQAIADGASAAGAAAQLGMTEDSVRYVLKSLTGKLEARSRQHAVAIGLHVGLIDPPLPNPEERRAGARPA